MDYFIIRFTCEKCGTRQENKAAWQPVPPSHPIANDPDKAFVRCKNCGHGQKIPLSEEKDTPSAGG